MVVVVFVGFFCCLVWAVGVFDVPLWVPLVGVGSEFLYRGVLYVCGV